MPPHYHPPHPQTSHKRLSSLAWYQVFLPPPLVPTRAPHLLREALSGAAAESLVKVATYPLDTLKSRSQIGIAPILTDPLRLFSGLSTRVAGAALDAAIFTALFVTLRRRLRRRFPAKRSRFFVGAAAALGAGIVSSVVEAPFLVACERIRHGFAPGASAVWRGVGVRGMYLAALPTLLRDLPFEMVEFGVFEGLCGLGREGAAVRALGVGVLAGAFAAGVVAPLDFYATRVRVGLGNSTGIAAVRRVVREEGVAVVFRGLGMQMGAEAASSAIFFTVYDELRVWFGVDRDVS